MKTAAGFLNWSGSHMWEKAIKYSHGQLAGVKLWYLVQSNNIMKIWAYSVGITKLQLQSRHADQVIESSKGFGGFGVVYL